MPTYLFECSEGHVTERVLTVRDETRFIKCDCGKRARKIIARVAFVVPEHMTAENDRVNGASRARHREWLKEPETKKRLLSGELAVSNEDI